MGSSMTKACRPLAFLLLLMMILEWNSPTVAKEPDFIRVQHILISFKGRIPGKPPLERTKKQADALADKLLARAQDGEEFDALVREYTDDKHPGIYDLVNAKAPLRSGARQRKEMVPKFGDVAFRLEVGEIGLVRFNSMTSPYGWHVIKRLE
jgi:hypothetical protein